MVENNQSGFKSRIAAIAKSTMAQWLAFAALIVAVVAGTFAFG